MVNFTQIKIKKLSAIFTILLSGLLLQACGGQRDEPFSGTSSSSSSVRGEAVTIKQLRKGDAPVTDVAVEGIRVNILTEDLFDEYWDRYTYDDYEAVDFEKGQVLLVDLGKKRSCDHKITLRSYSAYQQTVNTVQVVLNYRDVDTASSTSTSSATNSSSDSSASSSCDDTLEVQPYFFFYIETRDEVIVSQGAQ